MTSEANEILVRLQEIIQHAVPTNETPTVMGVETPWPKNKLRKATTAHPGIVPENVVASLDDAIWSVSPDGSRVYHLAGGVDRTFGRPAGDFFARPSLWFDIAADGDRAALRDAFHQLPHTGAFHLEYAIKARSGSLRWVNARGRLIRAADGTPISVDGITTDSTVRTKTERTGLAMLEAIGPRIGADLLNSAVEHLAKGFDARAAVIAAAHPADHRVVQSLAAWIDGHRADPFTFDASGRFVRDLLAGGSQFIPSAARDRFPADEFLNRMRAESVAAAPLIAADGRLLGFIAVLDDRSLRGTPPDARGVLKALAPRIAVELHARREAADSVRVRELEDELAAAKSRALESERFETAGRLLAGSVHDFMHFLTLSIGHAELLRENLTPDSPLRESVEVIMSSGHAAARAIRQVAAYTQPPSESSIAATLDPNAVIAESRAMLVGAVGKRIELDLLLTPGVAPIRADRSSFDRVVFNLVNNAKDAIEDSGVITVITATTTVNETRRGWPAECPPGEYVAVTVADTGCGMSEEVKARAFSRFFTTKGIKGSGLGLPTVVEIVRAAGGHVELESSTEWGTRVRVFWPAAAEDDEPVSLSFEEALIGSAD